MNLTIEEYFKKLNISTKDVISLKPDGSDRQFFRLNFKGMPAIAIIPANGSTGEAEAKSLAKIAAHLSKAKVHIPPLIFYDSQTNIVFMEDKGDLSFQKAVLSSNDDNIKQYQKVITVLADFQIKGIKGFDPSWCYDSPKYDSKLALEREVLYFIDSFLKDFADIKPDQNLYDGLQKIALKADEFHYNNFLLHRDFQSRNILIEDAQPWIIDFQAARVGPLAYDLASLLIDPYVNISSTTWNDLIYGYVHYANKTFEANLNIKKFMEDFATAALLRSLQILGAFSFLSQKKKKAFFLQYVPLAIMRLKEILDIFYPSSLYNLRKVVEHLESQQSLWNFKQ